MLRVVLGWLLILHGLAHADAGMTAFDRGPVWVAQLLWWVAMLGYMLAGLGLLRVPVVRTRWKLMMASATIASITMMLWIDSAGALPGVAIDVALLIVVLDVLQPRLDADIDLVESVGRDAYRHARWVAGGWIIGGAAAVYCATVVAARPISLRWGSRSLERTAQLPGDDAQSFAADYRIDHAITIHAPASAVWPWLAQLGQDRGGFYSYDWLERAFGDHVRNADRIHPDWQHREVGDTVFATQPGYLGGRAGALGWRITTLEPNRVIGLQNWGTFVLEPIDSATTRLIVRTRGRRSPGPLKFVSSPLEVFVFEPAHFIMERGMLRGIRDRAERHSPRLTSTTCGEFPHNKSTFSPPKCGSSRTDGPLRQS